MSSNQYTKNIKYEQDQITYFNKIVVTKDELTDLYLNKNLTRVEISEYYGLKISQVVNCLIKFDLKKSKELKTAVNKRAKLEHFGNANYNNKSKQIETMQEKYGVDNIFKCVPYIQACMIKKYGVAHPYQDDKIKEKGQKTFEKHWSNKMDELNMKRQSTCLKHYGVKFPMQIDRVKDHFRNSPEIYDKSWNTKKKHHTTNTSSDEKSFKEWLNLHFKKEDIFQNYKSEIYPYHCDFYIKSLNCYIELNLFWTHGKHLFNPNDKNDLEVLEQWKLKASQNHPAYLQAINIWTKKDPEKFKAAKDNNLNYLVIYNKTEINSLKEKIISLKEKNLND